MSRAVLSRWFGCRVQSRCVTGPRGPCSACRRAHAALRATHTHLHAAPCRGLNRACRGCHMQTCRCVCVEVWCACSGVWHGGACRCVCRAAGPEWPRDGVCSRGPVDTSQPTVSSGSDRRFATQEPLPRPLRTRGAAHTCRPGHGCTPCTRAQRAPVRGPLLPATRHPFSGPFPGVALRPLRPPPEARCRALDFDRRQNPRRRGRQPGFWRHARNAPAHDAASTRARAT